MCDQDHSLKFLLNQKIGILLSLVDEVNETIHKLSVENLNEIDEYFKNFEASVVETISVAQEEILDKVEAHRTMCRRALEDQSSMVCQAAKEISLSINKIDKLDELERDASNASMHPEKVDQNIITAHENKMKLKKLFATMKSSISGSLKKSQDHEDESFILQAGFQFNPTWRDIISLYGHINIIEKMVFLPDGLIVSCSSDKSIKVWDYTTQSLLYELRGHKGGVLSLAALQRGKLASCSADGTIKIWDLEEQRALKTLERNEDFPFSLVVLRNGNLASCSKYEINIWNPYLQSNNYLFSIDGFVTHHWFDNLCVLSSGYLVLLCADRKNPQIHVINIWDPETAVLIKSIEIKGELPSKIRVLSNDDIAIGFQDGSIQVIDILDESKSYSLPKNHENQIIDLTEIIHTGYLVSCSTKESHLVIWELKSRSCIFKYKDNEGPISHVTCSPCGRFLAISNSEFTIKMLPLVSSSKALDSSFKSSDLFSGRYRIIEQMDQTSFVRTFLIEDAKNRSKKILKEFICLQASQIFQMTNSKFQNLKKNSLAIVQQVKSLNHANVLSLLDHFNENIPGRIQISLVTEHFNCLKDFINTSQSDIYELKSFKWIAQIAEGLEYIHSKDLVHGNLTIRNIYLDASGESLKIGLFHFGNLVSFENAGIDDGSLEDKRYFSPQRILRKNKMRKPTQKDDCWSFGCVLYEIVRSNGAFTGSNCNEIIKAIVEREVPDLQYDYYSRLYKMLMHKEEDQRATSEEAKMVIFYEIRPNMLLDGYNINNYIEMRKENPSSFSNIKLIDSDAFDKWIDAPLLNLSYNKLSSIQKVHFKSMRKSNAVQHIKEIKLNNNNLTMIEATSLDLFEGLQVLNLDHNLLEELNTTLFEKLLNLRGLSLNNNKLTAVEARQLEHLKSLESLNLSFNSISITLSDQLANLENLQFLTLSHNKIQEIEPTAFKNLHQLTRLHLDHNELVDLMPDLFDATTKLIDLKLNNNSIKCLHIGLFKSTKNLKKLDLSFNRICKIEPTLFDPLSKLETLNLGFNRIDIIIQDVFGRLVKLRELRLDNNRLKDIDLRFFSQPRLQLQLDDNDLETLEFDQTSKKLSTQISLSGNEKILKDLDFWSKIKDFGFRVSYDHIKSMRHNSDQRNRIRIKEIPSNLSNRSFVTKIIFLPDGNLISSACEKNIKAWDTRDGRILYELIGHEDFVYSIALLPNNMLASCSGDRTVKIWNLEDARLVKTFTGHEEWVLSLVVLKNGNLASCSNDDTIKIWNPTADELVNNPLITMAGHGIRDWYMKLDIFPNGFLVSCSDYDEAIIRIWNPVQGELVKTIPTNHSFARNMVVLSDDSVAVGFATDKIIIVDTSNSSTKFVIDKCHKDGVYSLAVLSNQYLISTSKRSQKKLKVWNPETGALVNTVTASGDLNSLAISTDGKIIASGSNQGAIRLFSVCID